MKQRSVGFAHTWTWGQRGGETGAQHKNHPNNFCALLTKRRAFNYAPAERLRGMCLSASADGLEPSVIINLFVAVGLRSCSQETVDSTREGGEMGLPGVVVCGGLQTNIPKGVLKIKAGIVTSVKLRCAKFGRNP